MEDSQDPEPIASINLENQPGPSAASSSRSQSGMAVRVVKFSSRGTKLERFLPKNQYNQRKLLNFEDWVKIGLMGRCQKMSIIFESKLIQKLMLSNYVNNKNVPQY